MAIFNCYVSSPEGICGFFDGTRYMQTEIRRKLAALSDGRLDNSFGLEKLLADINITSAFQHKRQKKVLLLKKNTPSRIRGFPAVQFDSIARFVSQSWTSGMG